MGIAAYLRAHGPWQVLHLERSLSEDVPGFLQKREFDGVISRIENAKMAKAVAKRGIPTVDLRNEFQPAGGVSFDTDPKACAALAIDHFYQRGFRNLAYCGYQGVGFSEQRRQAFVEGCGEKNGSTFVDERSAAGNAVVSGGHSGVVLRESEGEIPEPELTDWIASLPSPTGIFACNDIRGRQILQAAMLAGRRAPDEIAVLGVKEVAAAASLARVTLERRFRKVLNRSLREEIERVRMEQVRVLLTETNYSLLEIASNTGYRSDAHLITAFHRRVTNLHIRVTPHASGRFQ